MKNSLKYSLFAILFLGSVSFAAAQVDFGVKAGFNLANVSLSGLGEDDLDTKMLPTFQVGAVADINISENFAIQPGVLLSGKGFRVEEEFLGETFKSTISPMYLQVPVNFLYKGNMFYVGAGPYVGFGLFGKSKFEGGGESDSEDISFGNSEDDDWAPLDFGANLEAGVILGQIRIGAGYALGLANVIPSDVRGDDESARNGVISVNVAYMFGGGDE
ncbi:MAG: PorT family protein [Saprospiraceae bacterium]|nr:PorT family protein [Saprospiraceae bacterium]